MVEIHEKWFQRLECIEVHWTLSLLPRGLATPGSGVGLKFGVGFGWVKIDLMCRWVFFFFFFSVLFVIPRSGTIVTMKSLVFLFSFCCEEEEIIFN